MPYCTNCGGELAESARFCTNCGQKVSPEAVPELSVQAPGAPAPRDVRISDYLHRGWELFKQYPGGFIGFTALSWLIHTMVSLIPFVGGIAAFILDAPLMVGSLIVAAKLAQRQPVHFGDYFKGFNFFGNLLLKDLVGALILGFTALPWIVLLALAFMSRSRPLFDWHASHLGAPSSVLLIVASLLGIIWLILVTYLVVSWIFSSLLILDRRLGFWEAMELSRHTVQPRWFGFFGFLLLLFLINLGGALLCLLPLLVTCPFSYCALTAAFMDTFGLQSKEY
jgi:hypothetical protein